MITIEEFSKEFNKRHDFEYDDDEFLPNKYSEISFQDIPEAWVCVIDTYLSKLKDKSAISSISQVMGLCVIAGESSSEDKKILQCLEKTISDIDMDLHEQLKSGIILN